MQAVRPSSTAGLLAAACLIILWGVSLLLLLSWDFSWQNPLAYIMVFVQMHLFTGLFITAHDAMHGSVSSNASLNTLAGRVCAFLYAGFFYDGLYERHHRHHRHVHTADDPDYAPHGFWRWYFSFMLRYLSWIQLLIMAVIFNLLKIWFPEKNILLFWVAPALLSTLQLFYFGTYLPHKGEHDNAHHARSQRKNHLAAFLSCYFFGYHLEHHEKPYLPWWQLYKTKDQGG
ncbi:fatty acid desaturase [Pedobacter yulinensis]|uniref:Fatty acid desaturase n=1 Tax=Pedobacter yulinensis TaxID=2126353 RepID=A0A2T3HQ41_9SPHI|nr:fatty acid desaturase [Pedobacter yulinensis]PST84585.1 fatty acid desaturase [Pedobacter yulinensis]